MEELSDKEFWRLTIDMSKKHKEDMIYSKEHPQPQQLQQHNNNNKWSKEVNPRHENKTHWEESIAE